ncbi:protein bric-a-brac 2 [Anabrus simplex]|uniref:protein bric-a-brac 2 n=1 Tax=Anabrus simplex TaxID=316456 RepID=UPI0035A3D4DD
MKTEALESPGCSGVMPIPGPSAAPNVSADNFLQSLDLYQSTLQQQKAARRAVRTNMPEWTVPQQGQVAQQKQLVQQTPPQPLPTLKKAPPSPQSVAAPKPAVPKQPPPPPPRPVSPPQPPPPPPEVCLRWNSYHSNMQATFPSLLNNEQFVDVTLACEGRSIKCHKMMLSACSAYFEELLSQNPCQHPIVLMKDLRYWEVQALVDFMYRGEVNVGQDKLPSLLAAAEALQIKGLAGPASTSSSHDEDSLPSTLPPNSTDDYMEESIPSPSSARRARKRRVMGSLPASHPLQPVPVTVPRNPVSRTRIPRVSDPLPSTSSYQPEVALPMSSEPPQRRPRRSEASDYLGHEIKIEPVDIDISNDSMDHGDDSYLDKGYDESGAVDEGGGDSSGQGDGGSVGGSNGGLVDHKAILTGQDSDQVDYGSNNGLESNVTGDRTGSDTKPQAFKYESGTNRDTPLSSAPDIPSVAYPEVVMNPSSSSGTGGSSGENLGDSMIASM